MPCDGRCASPREGRGVSRWAITFTRDPGAVSLVGSGESIDEAIASLQAILRDQATELQGRAWSYDDAADELKDLA